jgi:hypothetical protein
MLFYGRATAGFVWAFRKFGASMNFWVEQSGLFLRMRRDGHRTEGR